MTEDRCPDCEAIITELDCAECLAYQRLQTAVRSMEHRVATLAPATRTHCRNGHEMNEKNTRVEVRTGDKASITRVCRTCHNARAVSRRVRNKVHV